jgi:hypothetical protein
MTATAIIATGGFSKFLTVEPSVRDLAWAGNGPYRLSCPRELTSQERFGVFSFAANKKAPNFENTRLSVSTSRLNGCVQTVHSIAQRQHGLLTRAQALECGLSDGDIRGRVRAGIWQRLYPGVYRVAGSRVTREQTVLAAILAAGGKAMASHGTAAELHGLPAGEDQIHITVVGRRIEVPGVRVHVVAGLQGPDCAVKNGIPVTTVARTIIDLAQVLSPERLEEVLDHALAGRLVSLHVLLQRLEKTGTQGRRGAGVLTALDGSPRPRQRAERLFLRIVARYGLPTPEREVEYHLSDGRTVFVDFVFCRVVGAEIDSFLHHSSLTDWAADRGRNNLLRARGLTLLNVTEPQMRSDPAGMAAQFQEALVSRGVLLPPAAPPAAPSPPP